MNYSYPCLSLEVASRRVCAGGCQYYSPQAVYIHYIYTLHIYVYVVYILNVNSLDSWDRDSSGSERGSVGGHPTVHTLRDVTSKDGHR